MASKTLTVGIDGTPYQVVDLKGDGTVYALQGAVTLVDKTGVPVAITAGTLPVAPGAPSETALTLPTLNNVFIDSASAAVVGSKKTIYLVVTTPLAWVTSGQPTWTPFASRASFAAVAGAATGLTANQVKLGTANNLGAAAQTALPAGLYRLSPATVAELQWPDSQIGVEIQFPSALTAGAAALYVESST